MGTTPVRSSVHRIVGVLNDSLRQLNADVPRLIVEQWGIALHEALASRARDFHTHAHVLEMVHGADPLEAISALYHDVVYVQVDLDVPPRFASLLEPLVKRETDGWRLVPTSDPIALEVLQIFGRSVGDVLTPLTGLNELASAFVAVKELEPALTREQRVCVATAIEATIPFRQQVGERLESRLQTLGVPGLNIEATVKRAIRLANRDVENFSVADAAVFLDHTWKLLPETNPALHVVSTYSIADYRVALKKMEGFLSTLDPQRVFQKWHEEPATPTHAAMVAAAAKNIAVAVRYLRAKLYAVAVLEGLAIETGGVVPVAYITGGMPEHGGPEPLRLENFLPEVAPAESPEPVLHRLLRGGRTTSSGFDVQPSPVAEHLIRRLGEGAVMRGFEQARSWWAGQLTPRQFLEAQSGAALAGVARACAEIIDTRRDSFISMAERYQKRSAP